MVRRFCSPTRAEHSHFDDGRTSHDVISLKQQLAFDVIQLGLIKNKVLEEAIMLLDNITKLSFDKNTLVPSMVRIWRHNGCNTVLLSKFESVRVSEIQ